MAGDTGPDWAKRFFAVTVAVDDLSKARQWYVDVFGMPIADESPNSCTFRFPGGVYVNLNTLAGVTELIEPRAAGPSGTPPRLVMTLEVDDVDALAERLRVMGVVALNGPIDRPWGSRTMSIVDPSGNCWELAS